MIQINRAEGNSGSGCCSPARRWFNPLNQGDRRALTAAHAVHVDTWSE